MALLIASAARLSLVSSAECGTIPTVSFRPLAQGATALAPYGRRDEQRCFDGDEKTVTRDELYREIWTEPQLKVTELLLSHAVFRGAGRLQSQERSS